MNGPTKITWDETVAFYILEVAAAVGTIGGACMIAFAIYVVANGDLP